MGIVMATITMGIVMATITVTITGATFFLAPVGSLGVNMKMGGDGHTQWGMEIVGCWMGIGWLKHR